MKRYLSLAITALLFSVSNAEEELLHHKHPCYIRSENRQGVVKEKLTPVDGLPANFTWSNVDGMNYLTEVKNQHLPQYCGSCWAQAAASAMSDRIKIMRKGAWPDINIAPQVLISCEMEDFGCHGGDSINAYRYIHKKNITDETCAIYRGRGHDNGV